MNLIDPDIKAQLCTLLDGRVCIVGVGNRARGDDGAGPRVIDARPAAAPGVWLDAGVAPENVLEPIVRTNPDSILIVDAVDFGGLPGQCRMIDLTAIDMPVISTHAGSFRMLSEYLSARTKARVRLIGIQPDNIDSREGLSRRVEAAAIELSAMLAELLFRQATAR